jgi:hypothetical protein
MKLVSVIEMCLNEKPKNKNMLYFPCGFVSL